MEDDAARSKPAEVSATDPAIQERLAQLEREAAALREALAAQNVQPTKEPEPVEEEMPPVPTHEEQELAEGFIRQARLARSRGLAPQATDFLKKAEAAAPGSPTVLEFVGDDYAERQQFSLARDCYRKALKINPKNVPLERKYAEMVLNSTNTGFNSLRNEYEVMASAKIAVVLTALLPGIGQMVVGELVKGALVFAAWLSCLLWTYFTPNGLKGLIVLLGGRSSGPGGVHFNATVLIPLVLGTLIWLGAIIDSTMKSKEKPIRKIEHPKPPDDLPFE